MSGLPQPQPVHLPSTSCTSGQAQCTSMQSLDPGSSEVQPWAAGNECRLPRALLTGVSPLPALRALAPALTAGQAPVLDASGWLGAVPLLLLWGQTASSGKVEGAGPGEAAAEAAAASASQPPSLGLASVTSSARAGGGSSSKHEGSSPAPVPVAPSGRVTNSGEGSGDVERTERSGDISCTKGDPVGARAVLRRFFRAVFRSRLESRRPVEWNCS
mmetsp:Transcript_2167/g.6599  ORF Transcript_2167/g.6599 Transcript_2167/m.6599 type:complete len:216 (+) Transcript_2167:241-888(+)